MVLRFDPVAGLDLIDPLHPGSSRAAADSGVPVDLFRQGDSYILNADLPGLDPGSLSLDVQGRLLTIRGHRTLEEFAGAGWLIRDRRRGMIERHVLLGADINTAGISAHYSCGILSVHLPVDPARRPRKVGVRYDGGDPPAKHRSAR